MPECTRCKRDLITVQYGGQTLILDPTYAAYAAVDASAEHLYPQNGDRVFLTTGLVEHRVVCAGQRRDEASARAQGKETYDKQRRAKRGVTE